MNKVIENNKFEFDTKDSFWQCIRGICIICVILIHCKTGLEYQGKAIGSWNFDIWLIMRQIINFPVAVFIFLSGYFTNIDKYINHKNQYFKRIKRLLIPFLVWSTLYTIMNVVISHKNVSIIQVILKILLGSSSAQLYFILVLIQLMILTPFIVRIMKYHFCNVLMFLITPVYLISLYCYAAIFKTQFMNYQTFFPAWFLFYYLGLQIKTKGYKGLFIKHPLQSSITFSIFALISSVFEGYLLLILGFGSGFASSQIKFSSFLYAFSIINLLFAIKERSIICKMNRILNKIGDNSYGLYYIHMIYIIIFGKLIQFVEILNTTSIFSLVQFLLTIIFSLATIAVAKKILGKQIYKKYLGF